MKEQCGKCGRDAVLFLKGGKPHSWECPDIDCHGWSKSAEPPPFETEVAAAWERWRNGIGLTWAESPVSTRQDFRAAVMPILERCAALEKERDALRIEVTRLRDDIAASADADIEIRSELGLGPDDSDIGTVDRIRELRDNAAIRWGEAVSTLAGSTEMLETVWCIKDGGL